MPAISLRLIALACAGALAVSVGWHVRGLQCRADMDDFKNSLAASAQDQRNLKAKVEAAQAVTTVQSTQRLDEQQADQQKVTVYVDRKVVEYRDRWRDRACARPAEWLQLYNDSLFGPAGSAVPETR